MLKDHSVLARANGVILVVAARASDRARGNFDESDGIDVTFAEQQSPLF